MQTVPPSAIQQVFEIHTQSDNSIAPSSSGNLSPFAAIRELVGNESGELWVIAAYGAAVGLLSLATPLAVSALVQSVGFSTVLQPLVVLTILLGAVLSFYSVLRALQAKVVELLQARLFLRVSGELAYRLPRVEFAAFDRAHGPELVNRFFDVLTLQKGAATLLLDGLALALQTIVGMLLLAFYHPLLLAFDVMLAGGLVIALVALGNGAISTSIDESKAKYALAAWLEELVRNSTAFRNQGGQAIALKHADRLGEKYILSRKKHWKILFRQIVATLAIKSIAHVALLGLGGWLVINRQLTLGQLVAGELVLTAVLTGVSKFGKQLETWYDVSAAADKLGHLLALPLEREGGVDLRSSDAIAVQLQNVSFAYTPEVVVLKRASVAIKPKAKVALVAATGIGRSTVLDLLYGLRRAPTGTVRIAGLDVREISLRSLRQRVELVRGVEVFEGTVEDNVRMGRDSLDRAAIHRALEVVGLTDEIAAMPDGIHTKLATGGSPLSPGEAQLLVLARAIVAEPGLLLIDQTLDRVFPHDRERLLSALLGPQAPWTAIVVSNDPVVIAHCSDRLEHRNQQLFYSSQEAS
jgi:ABC-type bacteriocin/lantibiotic exporter with double-glycine peptidase domain